MTVLVDTSAFYAMLVRTEERHEEVVRALSKLARAARPLTTTSYVVVETAALVQSRIGLEAVRDLFDRLLPLVSVEWVTESLHRRGVRRLLQEDRRGLSLVDCVSLELMATKGIREALALDPHFAQAGFRLLPSPVGQPSRR